MLYSPSFLCLKSGMSTIVLEKVQSYETNINLINKLLVNLKICNPSK